jgi:hypothetical protein
VIDGPDDGVPPDDVGEPIDALRRLAEQPSPGFVDRVGRSIERRSFTSHLVSLTWHLPRLIVLEFVEIVFHFLGPRGNDGGGPS